MKKLIIGYINKLTLDNIKDFANLNNIFLNDKELNVIYDVIKNNYTEILDGDDTKSIALLKESLSEDNFSKVINLYHLYLNKYKNYL